MKDTICAYAAGLIDGEGYIGLHTNSVSKHSFMPVIKLVSTDPYMAKFLQEHFKGSISTRKRMLPHHINCIEWMLRGKENIKFFLTSIRPYMLVKADQADHLLSFIDEVGDFKGKRTLDPVTRKSVYDEKFVARRLWYYQEGKRLRHQFRAVAETK